MPYKNKNKQTQYFKDYYFLNKEQKDKDKHRSHLKKQFGITATEYDEILVKQNHRCAICEKHILDFDKRFAVDHCHETGKIRGLLCMVCNTALGKFKDNVEMLRKAIYYLQQNMSV